MNKTVQENYHFKTMNMNWVKVLLKHLHLILCTKNCLKIRIGVLHNASKDKIGKKNKYIRTIRARTQKRTHTHAHTHSLTAPGPCIRPYARVHGRMVAVVGCDWGRRRNRVFRPHWGFFFSAGGSIVLRHS